MQNDTSFNILASYAYLKNQSFLNDLIENARRKNINLMFDSGAVTLRKAKGADRDFITIDKYCQFIDKFGDYADKYIMLDVIGKHKESLANYEIMIERGLNPMFVLTHYDNDFDHLRYAVSNNPNICVAGGNFKNDWVKHRYQKAYKETNNKALIHGLAFVKFPDYLQLPLCSVDSISWYTGGASFGNIHLFHMGKVVSYYQSERKQRGKVPQEIIDVLNQLRITPAQFFDKRNFVGNKSIAILINAIGAIRQQRFSYTKGVRQFFAVCNQKEFDVVKIVHDNWDNITYEKYVKQIS